MEYNESNFFYLKNTSMEKYYESLLKAEYLCEYFPKATKVIVRKVIEGFLKDLAEKHNIEADIAIWQLIEKLKNSKKVIMPEEIYKYIRIILVNAYEHSSYNYKIKRISKHPIEILEASHNIFCWYLKNFESRAILEVKNYNFKAPSTIEYMEKEITKINEEILLKDRQINKLRQKLIEEASQLKNISSINNTIISIKEEKSCLEKMQIVLKKKTQGQKKQVSEMEKEYSSYAKKMASLSEKCNESQELIFGKESQLVKAEIQKQEAVELIQKLEEQDDSIKRIQHYLDDELKTVRHAYENLVDLTKAYEDILETMEFSYDKSLQKILGNQQKNILIKISFEDKIFNENLIAYSQNIIEAKRKALIFKEILNERIKKEIKYEIFYRGFLGLAGKELRIIYFMVSLGGASVGLFGKSKDLSLRPTEDKILELMNKKLEVLKNVDDNELRLIVYYKLIKLSQISPGSIYNRKHFINALDNIVDKAYEFLLNSSEESKFNENKIDTIISYYLRKILDILRIRNHSIQINDELIYRIYKNIISLRNKEEHRDKQKIYYEKFNLDIMTENMYKDAIKSYPFEFLSIMIELGSSDIYLEFYYIIFQVYNLIEKRFLNKDEQELISESLPKECFMVLIFLSNIGDFLNEKGQENLLTLLVMDILSVELIAHNEITNLENYKEMINLWKQKQHKYSDIFIEIEEEENKAKSLIEEKQELEFDNNELLKKYDILVEKYNNYNEEFKNIIMNSEKRVLLPSYMNYDDMRSKKEAAEKYINESKNKFGTFKSMLSPGVWKEKASKFVNESNMLEAEKTLIEEAKKKPYFKKDYEVFSELEEQINHMKAMVDKSKGELEKKNILIEKVNTRISELNKQLKAIKDVYVDIEDLY